MSLYDRFRQLLDEETSVVLATVVAGPPVPGRKMLVRGDGESQGSLGNADLDSRAIEDALRLLGTETSDTVRYDLADEYVEVFFDVYPAPPQLIVVGATQAAVALSSFGKDLGYRVIITDARAAFAVQERFPRADRVIKGWPQDVFPTLRLDNATFVVLLSHDPKFDGPTLEHVLPSGVRYIGAIGSRKTQQERFDRLREAGYTEEQLSRIYGPVGLDIGGKSAEETALAIIAEITAVRNGREGGFMRRRILAETAR